VGSNSTSERYSVFYKGWGYCDSVPDILLQSDSNNLLRYLPSKTSVLCLLVLLIGFLSPTPKIIVLVRLSAPFVWYKTTRIVSIISHIIKRIATSRVSQNWKKPIIEFSLLTLDNIEVAYLHCNGGEVYSMIQSFFAPLVIGLLVALFTDWLDRRRHK